MRQLASIQKITDIQEIPNADQIEVATILGWKVVIAKKDNFKIGDLVVYIEIDSQVPSDNPMFDFLSTRKYRIRSIRLRGVTSQGLIMPLSILSEKNWREGEDVTDTLCITKYDPQAIKEKEMADKLVNHKTKNPIVKFLLRYNWFRNFYHKKTTPTDAFPTHLVKKTDETRIQGMAREWESFVGKEFDHCEKIDGQSGTYILNKKNFMVCSRNLHLRKKDMKTSYWDVAIKYDIENILKFLKDKYRANLVVIQGEICSDKIQGGKYLTEGNEIYVFNLIIDGKSFTTPEIIEELKETNLKIVPYLGKYTFNTVEDLLKYAEGKSVLNDKVEREGIVLRLGEISFKAISNKYLLKNQE